ncbi:flagellar hook capping FlgD N-terminal domain-containing protein [Jannaschia marina]|uniref:flagellar hook capping FlgD N-terminal domain-containing protein n=1 Tax=Jannaschia marina TaxID=2741674 RepID=UPI0015C84BBA|nr:flagellar hook capping FlgD N-terminal domain-containing protein [Jannaschia marina]
MDILPLGPTAPAASSTASQVDTPSDFDTFLRLLTAQIRNQDPLDPTDSTAYTAQLATFSNVEQSVKTNDLLAAMIARLDAQQINGAADWIGMDVRHNGPLAHDGTPTELYTHLAATADRAELVVQDAAGVEVDRVAIDPRSEVVTWPADGVTRPDGLYQLSVESWAGDLALTPTRVDHYAQVTEVLLGDAGTELLLDGRVRLPAYGLQSIRPGGT